MSESMVVSAGIPEVVIGTGTTGSASSVPASFSGAWSDFGKDMAAIAAEMGQAPEPAQPPVSQPPEAVVTPTPSTPAPVVAQVAPVTPTPVAATPAPAPVVSTPVPEVPEKFRAPDGKLDQEKLLKSYFEASKELGKKSNELHQLRSQPQVAPQGSPTAQPVQAPVVAGLSHFEAQVAQDIFNGGGFTEQQAISMARVQVRLAEAKHQADVASTFAEVNQFRDTLAEQRSRQELETLAKNPATNWVLTPEGYKDLTRIRQENPEINQSENPWSKAVKILLGERQMYGQAGLVNMPIPTGVQQSAPPLPVTPTPPASNPIQLNTRAQVEAYVETLSPEQEAKFWQLQGLRWDAPKQFKGI